MNLCCDFAMLLLLHPKLASSVPNMDLDLLLQLVCHRFEVVHCLEMGAFGHAAPWHPSNSGLLRWIRKGPKARFVHPRVYGLLTLVLCQRPPCLKSFPRLHLHRLPRCWLPPLGVWWTTQLCRSPWPSHQFWSGRYEILVPPSWLCLSGVWTGPTTHVLIAVWAQWWFHCPVITLLQVSSASVMARKAFFRGQSYN